MRQLAAEPAFLHAAKCHPRVRHAERVDKDPAGFQLIGNRPRLCGIGREDARGQAKLAVIGQRHGVLGVAGGDDRGHGAEQFLFERRHVVGDVGQDGRFIVIARARDFMAAQQQRGAFFQGRLDLAVQFVTQIKARHGADIGGVRGGLAHHQGAAGFKEFGGEGFNHARFDDQALGGGADLAAVLEAADDRGLHGGVEVGVVEHDKRVGATQFQHAFLQCGPGL